MLKFSPYSSFLAVSWSRQPERFCQLLFHFLSVLQISFSDSYLHGVFFKSDFHEINVSFVLFSNWITWAGSDPSARGWGVDCRKGNRRGHSSTGAGFICQLYLFMNITLNKVNNLIFLTAIRAKTCSVESFGAFIRFGLIDSLLNKAKKSFIPSLELFYFGWSL